MNKYANDCELAHIAKQGDKYWEPVHVCPWCGCQSKNEDYCTECGESMSGEPYIACPYCGNEASEEYAMNNSCCGEKHWERREPGHEPTAI